MSALAARSPVRPPRLRPLRQASDPPARDDRTLFVQYRRTGDARYREQLVARFLPLAHHLARRYLRGGESLDDLVQVASLGLVKAIDRFDPRRETAFTSFAVPTIAGELKRHFRDKGWFVRVPRDLQELALRVERTGEQMATRLGRLPTPTELADELDITVERVLEAREAIGAHYAVSLDRPREDGEDDESIGDAIGAEDSGYGRAEDAASVQRLARGVLTDRERELLRLRFEQDLTQAEIGTRLGVSQMHVSRMLRSAVERLRHAA
jgi:RNA polymerase sigma-B factor